MSTKPLVSILTPTYNRRQFIPQYLKYIRAQNYQGPMEVIIVDDGEVPISDLVERDSLIRYIRFEEKKPLGFKRNLLAQDAKGDILIHMDDDDYYPPTRVSHAVDRLLQDDKLIAGASMCYFYNTLSQVITVGGPFGAYHGTAGTFAYFKEYTKTHAFSDEAEAQEEPLFTNGFTVPMVQLEPKLTMLIIQHLQNTWDKSKTSMRPTTLKPQDFIKHIDDRRFYRKLSRVVL